MDDNAARRTAAYQSAFVTGGAGFIGSRYIRKLRAHCPRIVVFDNLHPQVHGDHPIVPPLPGVEFVRGDVRDAAALGEAVAQTSPELIVHFAAETGTGQSQDTVSQYCDVNVTGTANLIEAVRGLPPASNRRRVVLASSRAIYGEGAYTNGNGAVIVPPPRKAEDMAAGRFAITGPGGEPLTPAATSESVPPSPASVYASTKLMQEYILRQALSAEHTELAILRFQNVYGPGQSLRNPYTGVLSIFAGQIQAGKILNIFEDGEIVRDFVYIDDVVDALMAATMADQVSGEPINIGSGKPVTILEVARWLLKLFGSPTERLKITGDFRVGDIRHAVADVSRAERELNWRPRISLEAGLRQLVQWVQSTPFA